MEGATMGEKVLEVVLTMREYGVDWGLGLGQRQGDLDIYLHHGTAICI